MTARQWNWRRRKANRSPAAFQYDRHFPATGADVAARSSFARGLCVAAGLVEPAEDIPFVAVPHSGAQFLAHNCLEKCGVTVTIAGGRWAPL
jgi:hypothetical protein